MSNHRTDIITRALADGRWFAQCLTCMEHSQPSLHKPIAEDWRREHIKAAGEGA